jgi:hypothetical protein
MYFFPAPGNIDHVNDFHHAAAVHFGMNALRATGTVADRRIEHLRVFAKTCVLRRVGLERERIAHL